MAYAPRIKGLDKYVPQIIPSDIDLGDLGDVTITAVADNELLAYDSGSGEWINQTANEAGLQTSLTFSTGLTNAGGTITTNDSQIDHDALLNFVANEHIDWTNATQNLLTTGSIEGDSLRVTGTTNDMTITESSDDFLISNSNSSKAIKFSVGSQSNIFQVRESNNDGQVRITNDSAQNIGTDVFLLDGEYNTSIASSMFKMNPTLSSGTFGLMYFRPTINNSNTHRAFWIAPNWANNTNSALDVFYYAPGSNTAGFDQTLTIFNDLSNNQWFNGATGDTITYNGFKIGRARTVADIGSGAPDLIETSITITGGATQFGANGSITQKGLTFSGFGTASGNVTVKALEADGGLFDFQFDEAANSKVRFGAGNDASIGYDGTDMVIDTALVGSGVLKFANATNWTANGTNTVTISNVAPSGVGTATISKWLTVKDNAGTVYYIPAWT